MTGVMAYTEANGSTDYECGYNQGWTKWWTYIRTEDLIDFGPVNPREESPILSVCNILYVSLHCLYTQNGRTWEFYVNSSF